MVSHSQDEHAHIFLLLWMFAKATLLAFCFVIVTLGIIATGFAYAYLHQVSTHAGVGIRQLFSIAANGWKAPLVTTDGRFNLLLLGVDSFGNRDNNAINTDTMMVVSLNLKTGKVTTFSIPRDLYLTSQKVKVNGIYNLSLKARDAHPEEKTKQAIENLTGISIHRVIVMEMNELGRVIDAMGGINVNVERAFTDERFPREDVDVTREHDPATLYKTVSFNAGTQHMGGQQALEFIRSRHSKDPMEGSDDARAKRQQRVIEGLVDRMDDRDIPRNPAYVGDLLKLYNQDFARFLPIEQVIAIGKTFLTLKRLPSFEAHHFAIQDFEADPIFYHPAYFYTGQWVYLPLDPSGKKIKTTVKQWLK